MLITAQAGKFRMESGIPVQDSLTSVDPLANYTLSAEIQVAFTHTLTKVEWDLLNYLHLIKDNRFLGEISRSQPLCFTVSTGNSYIVVQLYCCIIRVKLISYFLNRNILKYMPQTHGHCSFNVSLVISFTMQQTDQLLNLGGCFLQVSFIQLG